VSQSGTLRHTFSFNCTSDGEVAYPPIVQASDGNFYGTTLQAGSTSSGGTIYELSTTGLFSVLYDFGSDTTAGETPTAGLTQATDGNLYGSTTAGGEFGVGTIFQLTPDHSYTAIYNFANSGDGSNSSTLMQHTNGKLYGTTTYGGAFGLGTVYSLDMGLGPFVTFVRPTGKVGQTAQILGQGLTGSTGVTFNGVPATSFSVMSDTYMTAVVPPGATTGPVVVTTPSGPLTSNVSFRISQ
jgi:uncharacterized repeat protein (TIGR03803 family)